MGFVQKLASRVKTEGKHMNKCACCGNPLKRKEPKIPKLTWKYIINLKNWR